VKKTGIQGFEIPGSAITGHSARATKVQKRNRRNYYKQNTASQQTHECEISNNTLLHLDSVLTVTPAYRY